jgi:hypothetical protein
MTKRRASRELGFLVKRCVSWEAYYDEGIQAEHMLVSGIVDIGIIFLLVFGFLQARR